MNKKRFIWAVLLLLAGLACVLILTAGFKGNIGRTWGTNSTGSAIVWPWILLCIVPFAMGISEMFRAFGYQREKPGFFERGIGFRIREKLADFFFWKSPF